MEWGVSDGARHLVECCSKRKINGYLLRCRLEFTAAAEEVEEEEGEEKVEEVEEEGKVAAAGRSCTSLKRG